MATTRKTNKRSAKRRSSKSPEQRQAEIDALKQTQTDAILALTSEQAWTDWLKAGRLFRSYSANNTLLILMQCPEATRVAGFNVWKDLGRKVVSGKGSSIKIWGKPYQATRWVDAGSVDESKTQVLDRKDGQVKVRSGYTRCPILSVFDISQTEGDPLPEVSTRLTDNSPESAARAQEVIALLNTWLTTEGWTIETAASLGGANGVTSHSAKTIRLAEGLSVTQTAKTLIHEAAHAVLHADDTWAKISEYHDGHHRGVAEVQAESVAYIVAGLCGLDTSDYSTGYVAGWASQAARSEKPEDIVAAVENTTKAVHAGVNALLDVIEGPARGEVSEPTPLPAAEVPAQEDVAQVA